MSTKYVCDWCYEEFPDRAQVAHADVTVGAHAELLHICAACAPNHLAGHFPDEPETAVDCGEPVTDGGSKLRCASCRATVTLDDTLELQAPEISDGTIARVRICEDCRPDSGNKRPVTAYKDLLKAVIKRSNGIEEEQTTLGDAEIMTDGGSIVTDELPAHITTVQTLGGTPLLRCQTCGSEDATLAALDHRSGCPDGGDE
jgi:protein-arginine kinase activator protein McsA